MLQFLCVCVCVCVCVFFTFIWFSFGAEVCIIILASVAVVTKSALASVRPALSSHGSGRRPRRRQEATFPATWKRQRTNSAAAAVLVSENLQDTFIFSIPSFFLFSSFSSGYGRQFHNGRFQFCPISSANAWLSEISELFPPCTAPSGDDVHAPLSMESEAIDRRLISAHKSARAIKRGFKLLQRSKLDVQPFLIFFPARSEIFKMLHHQLENTGVFSFPLFSETPPSQRHGSATLLSQPVEHLNVNRIRTHTSSVA